MTDTNETPAFDKHEGSSPEGVGRVIGGQPRGGIIRRMFSFPVFLGTLLVAGAYMGKLGNLYSSSPGSSMFFLENDTWWHLAVASRILRTHSFPTHDIYSFTALGSPWIDYEWFGDMVLDLFWKHGGLQGLMLFVTVLAGIIMALVYYYASLRSGNFKAAFVACALLLPLASLQFTSRPQVLGYALLIATLICLEKFRQGRSKALWLLPVIFWFWVNSHGTFVLGFFILGVYWACGLREFRLGRIYAERWRPVQRRWLELAFLLCLLASILTPYGTQLAGYPLKMFSSQHQIMQAVQEWQPLDLSQLYGKIFLVLLILFWAGLATTDLTFRAEDLILLSFATIETFLHARFVILFVPVFAPLGAQLLARWVPQYDAAKDHRVLNFALVSMAALGITISFPSNPKLTRQLEYHVPTQAALFLKQHPNLTRVFNDANWGPYLIFALGPSHKVFMDGRYDIYEYSGVLQDYLSIIHVAPDTPFLLKKYGVDSCLVPHGSSLATLLSATPGWGPIYQDNLSIIYYHGPGSSNRGSVAANPGETVVHCYQLPSKTLSCAKSPR
jgi:hypothetical protein